MGEALQFGPFTDADTHVCVDMQRMFAEETDWHTPWMKRVLPNVVRIARARPRQTICTRFIPATTSREATGTWVRYYERWSSMTLENLGEAMIGLVQDLADIDPRLETIDKKVYSPWLDPALDRRLRERGSSSIVVTGGETDVCVLATVLGAVDRGYRVVVVEDGLCSSADAIHDDVMELYRSRFGQQIEIASSATVLRAWGVPSDDR